MRSTWENLIGTIVILGLALFTSVVVALLIVVAVVTNTVLGILLGIIAMIALIIASGAARVVGRDVLAWFDRRRIGRRWRRIAR